MIINRTTDITRNIGIHQNIFQHNSAFTTTQRVGDRASLFSSLITNKSAVIYITDCSRIGNCATLQIILFFYCIGYDRTITDKIHIFELDFTTTSIPKRTAIIRSVTLEQHIFNSFDCTFVIYCAPDRLCGIICKRRIFNASYRTISRIQYCGTNTTTVTLEQHTRQRIYITLVINRTATIISRISAKCYLNDVIVCNIIEIQRAFIPNRTAPTGRVANNINITVYGHRTRDGIAFGIRCGVINRTTATVTTG